MVDVAGLIAEAHHLDPDYNQAAALAATMDSELAKFVAGQVV